MTQALHPGPMVRIEIVYAEPREQAHISLEVVRGTTVGEALRLSQLPDHYPGLATLMSAEASLCCGIFGCLVGLDHVLEEGDRLEIYRPLTVDPKEARRRRAQLKLESQQKSKPRK